MEYESFENETDIYIILKPDNVENFMNEIFIKMYKEDIDIPLPPKEEIPYGEFLELFNSVFEPDEDNEIVISSSEINLFLNEMQRIHHNKWLDIFVKQGYGEYGVDTDGEITFIPNCKKIKIETDENGNSFLKPKKKRKSK